MATQVGDQISLRAIGRGEGPRKSLLDHFYDASTTLTAVSGGKAAEQGDFVQGVYESRIRRSADKIQVQLTRLGHVAGREIRIIKGVTLEAGSPTLDIAYVLENLPSDQSLNFAIELNFAGLPAGADDRYYHDGRGNRLGQLGRHPEALGCSQRDERGYAQRT